MFRGVLPLLGLHVHVSGSGGPPTWFVLLAVGALLVSLAASMLTAQYASGKGFPFVPILLASFFISFPIVLLIVALAPSRKPPIGSMPPHWRKY